MSCGNRFAFADLLNAGIVRDFVGNYVIDRQQELHVVRLGVGESLRGEINLVGLEQRLADLVALRLEEGVGHAAANDQGVHLAHQVLDDADLVAHLGAAKDCDERLLRMRQRLAQIFQFLLHQQAGRALLHKMRDALGRGVGAMRRAESIVHVVVAELGKLPGEIRIVGFLLGMEAEVLQQQRLPTLQLVGHLLRLHANAVGRKSHVLAAPQNVVEQNAQPLGHRLHAHLGIGLALGTSQVRRQNEPRAMAQRVLNAGQRLADAGVIHHAAVVERDVEIHAHEDALVVQRKITNR